MTQSLEDPHTAPLTRQQRKSSIPHLEAQEQQLPPSLACTFTRAEHRSGWSLEAGVARGSMMTKTGHISNALL